MKRRVLSAWCAGKRTLHNATESDKVGNNLVKEQSYLRE